ADPNFCIFAICSTLICIPLAYYYGMTANYLSQVGFSEPGATMTIGQMSEIVFMLLIPFFFRRLGVKWMILVGMLAWVARYLLFAYGAPDQVAWMIFIGIALHGICYDFFFVTGFMYTDHVAPKEIRGQAQSLLVFITQGIGMYVGYAIVFGKPWMGIKEGQATRLIESDALANAVAAARPEETLTFGQSLWKMFSVDMPTSVDGAVIAKAMEQWKDFWIFPAIVAAVIAVIFFLSFWDKTQVTDD
ncbi:MAG: MFS transporter, partial [Verrucomicrobiae bacterium]|nr:MFS transporter [Verrucomicrobiae bacterium]